jgi:hypothetical protein
MHLRRRRVWGRFAVSRPHVTSARTEVRAYVRILRPTYAFFVGRNFSSGSLSLVPRLEGAPELVGERTKSRR